MSIEAMKQALEALALVASSDEWHGCQTYEGQIATSAYKALRQAIAEAEDAVAAEREACAKVCEERERANLYGVKECAEAIRARGDASAEAEKIVPSDYPNSHQQEPDHDIYDVWVEQGTCQQNRQVAKSEHDIWIAAACLKSTVESAIKAGDWKVDGACDPTRDLAYLADCLANPKREWVRLTDEEIVDLACSVDSYKGLCQAIEAKLKEKNA
jgi:hypothetical protein